MEINRIDAESMTDDGVYKSFSLDMAYGEDENDYEIEMDIETESFKSGDMWYMEGTEYGGIVDGSRMQTSDNKIAFYGRSWHGLLESKIIIPPEGAAYYEIYGDANVAIGNIIEYIGLSDIFTASAGKSSYIEPCGVRFEPAYTALRNILTKNGMKLHITTTCDENYRTKIELSAVRLKDYSIDEEWDSSQLSLDIDEVEKQINHLICLGSGNMADRHVIHIFTDQNGTVQQVTKVDNPIKDSDYILDESKKVLSGIDEICQIYDYPNIESVENYELLQTEPADWSVQPNYYRKNGDKYETLSNVDVTRYKKLSGQPSDWVEKYTNYYQIANGVYSNIPEQSQYNYNVQSEQPSDWGTNYGNYYYYISDGTSYSYEKVKSASEEYYEQQTMMPSDWNASFGSYYEYNNGQYVQASAVTDTLYGKVPDLAQVKRTCTKHIYVYDLSGTEARYDKTTLYATVDTIKSLKENVGDIYGYEELYKSTHGIDRYSNIGKVLENVTVHYEKSVAEAMAKNYGINIYKAKFHIDMPDQDAVGVIKYTDILKLFYQYKNTHPPIWKAGYYYTKKSRSIAPQWKTNTYYTLIITHNPPDFLLGKYYEMYVDSVPNKFVANKYYKMHIDHFKNLVEAGTKKLAELRKMKTVGANISGDSTYDIGDMVGINEVNRGLIIKRRIVKKIVNCTGDDITISYKLGE